ncbi:MAG: S49 family peptidase [Acidobacteriota bacterium]
MPRNLVRRAAERLGLRPNARPIAPPPVMAIAHWALPSPDAFLWDDPPERDEFEVYRQLAPGVAQIRVAGALDRRDPPWWSSRVATTYPAIVQAAERARADDSIETVLLWSDDSPGGSTSGLWGAIHAVAELAATKTVVGFADGAATSAAYWLLSPCTEIVAEPTATVGSLGAYSAFWDSSLHEASIGWRRVVVQTQRRKADFVQGAPVTDAMTENYQRFVDETEAQLVQALTQHRGLSQADVDALEGRYWTAAAAPPGLVDRIVPSYSSLIAELTGAASPPEEPITDDDSTPEPQTRGARTMSTPTTSPESTPAPAAQPPAAETPAATPPTQAAPPRHHHAPPPPEPRGSARLEQALATRVPQDEHAFMRAALRGMAPADQDAQIDRLNAREPFGWLQADAHAAAQGHVDRLTASHQLTPAMRDAGVPQLLHQLELAARAGDSSHLLDAATLRDQVVAALDAAPAFEAMGAGSLAGPEHDAPPVASAHGLAPERAAELAQKYPLKGDG